MRLVKWISGQFRDRAVAQNGGAVPAASLARGDDTVAQELFEAGRAAFANGNLEHASIKLNAVLDIRFDHADAYYYLGLSNIQQGHLGDASECLVLAAQFKPDFPDAYYHLGLVYRQQHDYAAAARCFTQAVKFRDNYCQAHNNLGYTLINDLEEYERGARHIEIAMGLRPHDPDVMCNYSALLLNRGFSEDALRYCDKVLALHGELHEVRLNRAMAALKLGQFTKAWTDYESRKLTKGNYIPRDFGFPEWNGESLQDKSILVYAEQGLGDQIMFASCLPDLMQRASHCVIECSPQLVRLFRRSFPAATVLPSGQVCEAPAILAQPGQVHFQTTIGSLPRFFRTDIASFPSRRGYLMADPERIEYWSHRIAKIAPGSKIGLSWRGGAASTRRALRSIALADLQPILDVECCGFFSVQYGDVQAELSALEGKRSTNVQHYQDAIDDYDETAALICALDMVISVQTAVVHLAGALGRPTWALLPVVPEWRYQQSGAAMPWYPSVRLFRQSRADHWQPVIREVATELEALVRSRGHAG